MQTAIPSLFMRGGSSRGPFFLASDLPTDMPTRDRVLLAVMGSPDRRQIDGMGGAHPLTSKVGIVSPSRTPGVALDFLFAQLQPDKDTVDTSPNCGNMLAAVVPFALEPRSACVVIHVSGLAAHTRNLQAAPQVSLLVMQAEVAGEPVHALPRVTLLGQAALLAPDSAAWAEARAAYLARFPEAEPMTQLGDFRFVAITLQGARQIAGFGAARSLDADALASVLRPLA